MAANISNPMLATTEQTLEKNLQPSIQQDYLKIVVAGMHILLDKGAAGFMAKLKSSKDPIGDCGRGAASLILVMKKQAQGVMPMKAAVPAGITLMLHGLDFVDRAKIEKVDAAALASASRAFTNTLFQKLNITPDMLNKAVAKAHAITQDPAEMEKINQRANMGGTP